LIRHHDLSGVTGLHSDGEEVQSVGDGAAAEGDQDMVGAELSRSAGYVGAQDDLAAYFAGDSGVSDGLCKRWSV